MLVLLLLYLPAGLASEAAGVLAPEETTAQPTTAAVEQSTPEPTGPAATTILLQAPILSSTPRSLTSSDYREYTRISTVSPSSVQSVYSPPTERPVFVTSRPSATDPPVTVLPEAPAGIRSEDLQPEGSVRVSSAARPVSGASVHFATKPPRVVTAAPLVRSTTPRALPLLPPAPAPQKHQLNTGNQVPKGGIKIKRPRPKRKDNGMSSLLYIPLMIQAQLIPMMLLKLKFLALKALTLGKLALLILGLNLLRNAIIGYDNDAEQYEHETLASQHYGYNGNPEYGSWINRRLYNPNNYGHRRRYRPTESNPFLKRSDIYTQEPENTSQSSNQTPKPDGSMSIVNFENHPFRAYQYNLITDKKVPLEKVK